MICTMLLLCHGNIIWANQSNGVFCFLWKVHFIKCLTFLTKYKYKYCTYCTYISQFYSWAVGSNYCSVVLSNYLYPCRFLHEVQLLLLFSSKYYCEIFSYFGSAGLSVQWQAMTDVTGCNTSSRALWAPRCLEQSHFSQPINSRAPLPAPLQGPIACLWGTHGGVCAFECVCGKRGLSSLLAQFQ